MSEPPPPEGFGEDPKAPWYVYDRDLALLHIAATLAEAEAWAAGHWGVVEIADREEVAANDYWYLLLAAPQKSGYSSRDFQAASSARTASSPCAGTRTRHRATPSRGHHPH